MSKMKGEIRETPRPASGCVRCALPAFVLALRSPSHPKQELLCIECLLAAIEMGELEEEAEEDSDDVDDESDSRWGA